MDKKTQELANEIWKFINEKATTHEERNVLAERLVQAMERESALSDLLDELKSGN